MVIGVLVGGAVRLSTAARRELILLSACCRRVWYGVGRALMKAGGVDSVARLESRRCGSPVTEAEPIATASEGRIEEGK